MANLEELKVLLTVDSDKFEQALKKAESNSSNLGNAIGNHIKGGIDKMQTALKIGAVALGGSIFALGAAAIKSAADVETMGVSLETAFQGNVSAAQAAQKQITDFAARTPFQLGEVLTAFIKLKNLGLDPSERALKSYGDTASAMGKSLDQMVEAVADAATGEFERLKEFGIKASSEKDKVTFTFRGVSTTVKKNSKEIEEYLLKLGETNFAGGMEKQSKTFGGLMSTLRDNISLSLAKIAKDSGLLDVAKARISKLSDLIQNIDFSAFTDIVSGIIQIFEDWDVLNDDLYHGLSKLFGREAAQQIQGTLQSIYVAGKKVYEEAIVPFVSYLMEHKDATIFAFSAIGLAILATFVPAMVAAVASAAPFILAIGAIGVAAFFLYRIWTENWWGVQDIVKEAWKNIQIYFGIISDWLYKNLPPAIEALRSNFEKAWNNTSSVVSAVWNGVLKPIFGFIYSYITGYLIPVYQTMWAVISNTFNGIAAVARQRWSEIRPIIEPVVNWIVRDVVTKFVIAAQMIIDNFKRVSAELPGIFAFLKNSFKNNLNGLIDLFNIFLAYIDGGIQKMDEFARSVPGGKPITFRVGRIPKLAKGVENFQGGLAYVHKGEVLANLPKGTDVIKASDVNNMMSGSGMDMTVNNYNTVVDAREIAQQLLFRQRMQMI